jgi:hypothetical protein
MNQVDYGESCQRYFKLQNDGVFLYAHKVALLDDVFED